MKKGFVIITVFAMMLSLPVVSAETGNAGAGGAWFKFGLGARALGMGGAFGAIAEGVDAIYYNPGGVGLILNPQVGLTYHSLSLDRNLNSAAFLMPVRNEAVLGLSWINSSVSDVPMIDSDRNPYSTFSNTNNSFGLSFAKRFADNLSIGGNLRYLQSVLDQLSAYTVGVDLGALYKPSKYYAFGFSVSDLGSNLVWNSSGYWGGDRGSDYTDKFPYRARLSAAGSLLDEALDADIDIVKIEKLDMKFYGGVEYWFMTKVTMLEEDEEAEDELKEVDYNKRIFGLRGGYADGSLTFGFSLFYPYGKINAGIDYAFYDSKISEGSSNIISLKVLF